MNYDYFPDSRELEMRQVHMAIDRTDTEINRLEQVLAGMRHKQIRRHRELARQQTLHELTRNPKS